MNVAAYGANGTKDTAESTPNITKDQLVATLPDKRLAKYVTDDVIDLVNAEPDSEMRRIFKENILTYTSVLTEGKFSLAGYINAIKFVSLKLMGDSSTVAYSKVFPDRYQALVDKGAPAKNIASFADNYSKNQMVVKIFEKTLIPTHILNAGLYQEAINTQAELMRSARSETVRQKAAESLIVNLKAPEATKVEIDVSYNNDMIDDLRATTRALAAQQRELIERGAANAQDIAHSEIIARKIEHVTDAEYKELD
jgi:hypothetical protein